MSASNILVTPRAAHLITDAAFTSDGGTLGAIASKVLLLPHLRAAMSARGCIYAVTDIRREIEHAAPESLDDLLLALPEMLSAAIAINSVAYPGMSAASWSTTLSLIAWCERRNRAFGFILSNDNFWVPKPYQPWQVLPVRHSFAPGVAGFDDAAATGAFDPRADGVRLLEAQRRDPYAAPGEAHQHRVGGFGELTTVDADGVRIERICRWREDRVGGRIEPTSIPCSD